MWRGAPSAYVNSATLACVGDGLSISLRSHKRFDEVGEGARLGTCNAAGWKHRPDVDGLHCPIIEHFLCFTVGKLRREHPFGGNREAHIGKHRHAYALCGRDAK